MMPYYRCRVCRLQIHYRGAPGRPSDYAPCAYIAENLGGECQWPNVPKDCVPERQHDAWLDAQPQPGQEGEAQNG